MSAAQIRENLVAFVLAFDQKIEAINVLLIIYCFVNMHVQCIRKRLLSW